MKNPQTTFAPTFLAHIIARIDGVQKARDLVSQRSTVTNKSYLIQFDINFFFLQRHRMFEKFNQERILINAVWKNDFLPQEIKDFAYRDIQKHPRDSTVLRINRRCTVTGKARGNFHQFRVSRFVFRNEADYNKVSGAERAHWLTGIDLKP